eukprot:TRINITY_DN6403_c1_g1_i2.p1 TRINITY_DN6403_c1_g1~~TRINITY_DN6403_c1_g1_i2.p1  ORF type:complete len:314 (+),score=79.95 TRINITY_DN6403_c1_g1_i2:333-1274(+)
MEKARTRMERVKAKMTKGFGGKGKGKKGKGKDGKGKNKDGKGKGKDGKGKKGKSKGKWGDKGEEVEEKEHLTKSLPLPSVLANCVALEAPFGPGTLQISTGFKRGVCRFFEQQGYCRHGDYCHFEHVRGDAADNANDRPISSTAWWILPSTLANRAGRPGEGPAGGVFGALDRSGKRMRATRVDPIGAHESRERRDGLLRRLLRSDVDGYYSAILQSVRYIVTTDFLQLERPIVPVAENAAYTPEASPSTQTVAGLTGPEASSAASEPAAGATEPRAAARAIPVAPGEEQLIEQLEKEELDDADIAELAEVLV